MKKIIFAHTFLVLTLVFFVRFGIGNDDKTEEIISDMLSSPEAQICSDQCIIQFNDCCFECDLCDIIIDYNESSHAADICYR